MTDRSTEGGPTLNRTDWKRVHQGGRLVRDELTGPLPATLHSAAWHEFQQIPMARWACSLISLLEPQQASLYRRRSRRPADTPLFSDIASPDQRAKAEKIYSELCVRHSDRLPHCPWLRPVLAGRARWLATHPDARGSEWGKRMRRRKGGKHTQSRYREQGWHPLASVRKAWGFAGS